MQPDELKRRLHELGDFKSLPFDKVSDDYWNLEIEKIQKLIPVEEIKTIEKITDQKPPCEEPPHTVVKTVGDGWWCNYYRINGDRNLHYHISKMTLRRKLPDPKHQIGPWSTSTSTIPPDHFIDSLNQF